jgi:hypothetical protein
MNKRYSAVLKQDIHIDKKKGFIMCADGQVYYRHELACLKNEDDETKRKIHEIKKIFKGQVIQ